MSDEILEEVLGLLYGDEISKANPDQADVGSKGMSDHTKRKVTAGLSGVGAAAGAAGLALGAKNLGGSYKRVRAAQKTAGVARAAGSKWSAAKTAASKEKFATGLIPLEVAGLGGELAATKILHGDTKKQVQKDLGELVNNASSSGGSKLTRAKMVSAKARKKGLEYQKKGSFRRLPTGSRGHAKVEKADRVEVTWSGDIAKANEEKQQIFGWASVIEVNGEPVVDLQGDRITAEEMEKAGYEYVMKSRKGGDMHLRDDWQPIQKSEMIESFIVTDDKREALGLGEDVPTGWWVGFQVRDPDVWAKVKSGERTGFSIHGHGRRSNA